MASDDTIRPIDMLKTQRSHVLFTLSNPRQGLEAQFVSWIRGGYRNPISDITGVLGAEHYEQDEVDITSGQYPRLPFKYLGLYSISVDGAEAADGIIGRITAFYLEQAAAEAPATWLYYPACEKAGLPPMRRPSMLTVAFANGYVGQEQEFREWYATRHIRHALNIPALVSGQTFERTQFQRPGAMEAKFATIAVYEQVGTPESIVECFTTFPPETFRFPSMDMSRFAESVYRPV